MDVFNQVRQSQSATLSCFGDLLSVKDLSKILGISEQTTYKEIRRGKFGSPLKFGREYRIPKIFVV